MSSPSIIYPTVQFPTITAPAARPPMTPAEAAKGHDTVLMIFDAPVLLTIDHGLRVQYPKGVHQVPRYLADHWYLASNNVRYAVERSFAEKVMAPASTPARRKR